MLGPLGLRIEPLDVARGSLSIAEGSEQHAGQRESKREAARDQLVEKPVRLPPMRDAGKRPILPRQADSRMLQHEHHEARLPPRETERLDRRH
jgi:hypothetical protein